MSLFLGYVFFVCGVGVGAVLGGAGVGLLFTRRKADV